LRRSRLAALAGVLLAVLLAAVPAVCEPPPPPSSPEGILSFAEALLASGDSFRAATEYLRFLHHYPSHPAGPTALRGLGSAYAVAGRWDEAAGTFARLEETAPSAEARWLVGAALYRAGRYGETAQRLLSEDSGEAGATLGTLALLRMGPKPQIPPKARSDLADAFSRIPKKSPGLAGTLAAVLPGAGHLYADRPRDAFISFLLNAGFLWGTYEAARREEWALAGVLGFFEAGWYTGNVVSAVNAAHKWNRREEDRFFNRWESSSLPRWGLAALPHGAGLAFTWRW